jgi:hypothetical protein
MKLFIVSAVQINYVFYKAFDGANANYYFLFFVISCFANVGLDL